jgi:hypothetical protein
MERICGSTRTRRVVSCAKMIRHYLDRAKRLQRRLNINTLVEDRQAKQLAESYTIGDGFKRIYFYHLGKTGGSSLKQSFYELSGLTGSELHSRILNSRDQRIIVGDLVYVGWNDRLINQGNYFFAGTHWRKQRFSLPENTFTLTCLRDPVQRILSRYKELVGLFREDPTNSHVQNSPWFSIDFAECIQNMPKKERFHQLGMFSKEHNVEEAFENVSNCSYFFITEDFKDGFQALARRLDLPLQSIHTRKAPIQFTPEPEDMQRLHEILEPEIALYAKVKQLYYERKQQYTTD